MSVNLQTAPELVEQPSAQALALENAHREIERLRVVIADREALIAKVADVQGARAFVAHLLGIAQRYGYSTGGLELWLTQQLGAAEALAKAVEVAMPLAHTHHSNVRMADTTWQRIVELARRFKDGA